MSGGRTCGEMEPENPMKCFHSGRWPTILALTFVLLAACSGPDSGDDRDPTPSPTATGTATVAPSPTVIASPTVAATPTVEPTATQAASPTVVSSPTTSASPTRDTSDLKTELPELADISAEGYIIAEEGTRTAQELANFYSDPSAHLDRLNDWGFKRHAFRAFSGPGDSLELPYDVLATINEYGSPAQAAEALQWLLRLATTTGATEVDPPRVGDSAVALTVPTSGGEPTASIYVQSAALVYVYFAQGGMPLDFIEAVTERVFARR